MLTANQNVYYTADTTTTTKRTTKPTPETVILANENKIINTKTNNNVVVDVVDNRCSKDKNLNDLYSTTLTTTTATAINKARTVMSHNHGVAVSMLEDGEEQEQASPEQLDDENENYVIDIGTMQIADESNHTAEATAFITDSNSSDSNNKSNNARQGTPEEDEAKLGKESAMEAEIETSEKRGELGINEGTCQTRCDNVDTETKTETEAKAKEELDQNYLHEIEISSVDEEQIISELVDASGQGTCAEAKQSNGVRIAFGIILRLMLPLANGVMRGFKGIRDARFLRVLKSVASSRQSLANLMAFAANTISLNLSSVQVSQRIEPILKLLKIRHTRDGVESLPDTPAIEDASCFPTTDVTPTPPSTPTKPDTLNMPFMPTGLPSEPSSFMPTFSTGKRKPTAPQTPAPKCCTLNVLAEPPPGQPILADIIFIHGLHGSQVNTWRQGLWENERQPEQFERPPKPPVRPPKRPKHTRTAPLHPPHKQKRARFAKCESSQRASVDAMGYDEMKYLDDGFFDATEQELKNSASYACGAPQDIQNCDGIEYSFPTFRLRLNDNGRQLQSATDKMNESFASGATDEPHRSSTKSTEDNSSKPKAATAKLSVDDPNYSKCWPGDWLPLDCPGVRVIALNYTTDPYLWRPLWKKKEPRSNLIERAREMTELLVKHRVGCGRPIVWVGHSKGGLFIKQIMVDAWESGRPAVAPLWRSSRGVFFYSVPHRGSHLACIKAPLLARSVEMLDIEKNNKYLLDLHRRFAGLYHLGHIKIEVFSFTLTFKVSESATEEEIKRMNHYIYPAMKKTLGKFELSVEQGHFSDSEILVLLGENGTGKTTFIRMLAGNLQPDEEVDLPVLNISYKPQKISPKFQNLVRHLLHDKIRDAYVHPQFIADVMKPMKIEEIMDQEVQNLSGGELQRVALVLCLGKPADVYLIDEPSAYLDSEQRLVAAKVIKRFILHAKRTGFVVEHDFIMATYLADRVIVLEGQPSVKTTAFSPQSLLNGMNRFLELLGITFRRDPNNFRPRINKNNSVKDTEQKRSGQFFFLEDDAGN